MIYETAAHWTAAPQKRVMLFGMSGLGKTYLSTMLRDQAKWFHYSVDYRIGTRYMGEHIADEFKRHAMQVPLLRELLMTDSIHVASNITFENLAPLSTYLGKPGDPARGGLPVAEYIRRQAQHREAEQLAMRDTGPFIERAQSIYGYGNFVCDTSGSICEVVDTEGDDALLDMLSDQLLFIWIEGSDAHTAELVRRFDRAPKPMYYQADFLAKAWAAYLDGAGLAPEAVDPDDFIRWTYARALAHRQPRYAAMARRGVTVTADAVGQVKTPQDFEAMIAEALDRKTRD